MAAYKMTPARRAAIRKAQAASARKRKKRAANRPTPKQVRNRKIVKGVAIGAAVVGVGVAGVYGAKEYQKSDTHYVRKSVSKSTRKYRQKTLAKTGVKATKQQVRTHQKRVRPLAQSNARKRTVKRAPGKAATQGRKVKR